MKYCKIAWQSSERLVSADGYHIYYTWGSYVSPSTWAPEHMLALFWHAVHSHSIVRMTNHVLLCIRTLIRNQKSCHLPQRNLADFQNKRHRPWKNSIAEGNRQCSDTPIMYFWSPNPERVTGRGQVKSPLVLQVGGCVVGLVTHAHQNDDYLEVPN
jgi:hypothetical protein